MVLSIKPAGAEGRRLRRAVTIAAIACFAGVTCRAWLAARAPWATAERHRVEADSLACIAALFLGALDVASPDDAKRFSEFGFKTTSGLDHRYPLRARLWQVVHAWPSARKQALLEYAKSHLGYATEFAAFALEGFGPAPRFVPTGRAPSMTFYAPQTASDAETLAAHLRWIHGEGGVGAFVQGHWGSWKALDPDDAELIATKDAVLRYLRWNNQRPLVEFDAMVDPFLAPVTGFGVDLPNRRMLLLLGPTLTDDDRRVLIAHEFTHQPLEAIISANQQVVRSIDRASCLFDGVDPHGYEGWPNFLRENLCRAVSYRVAGVPDRDTGFALEGDLGRELRNHEANASVPFDQFMVETLDTLARARCRASVSP